MGTWTVVCPNQGIYAGEGHFSKKGEGLIVHLKKTVKIKNPRGESCEGEGNPRTRGFLPHGLTACEKRSKRWQRKARSCIRQVELKCCGRYTTDYETCECNPVAVCRATIPCP